MGLIVLWIAPALEVNPKQLSVLQVVSSTGTTRKLLRVPRRDEVIKLVLRETDASGLEAVGDSQALEQALEVVPLLL